MLHVQVARALGVCLLAWACAASAATPAAAAPRVQCLFENDDLSLRVPVPVQPDALGGSWTALYRFRVRTVLAAPPGHTPWLAVEVHAESAFDGQRTISVQKVGPPFDTGVVEAVAPSFGHHLVYRCAQGPVDTLALGGGPRGAVAASRSATAASALPAAAQPVARVAWVGDVMLADSEGTGAWVRQGRDPLAAVRDLLKPFDVRVANFESSAGHRGQPDPSKPFNFRTTPQALDLFASVFEVASLANNHTGDFGRGDVLDTLQALGSRGVRTVGAGASPALAHRALHLEVRGVKLALLGYLEFLPRWFAVGPDLPGVAWLDPQQVKVDIERARAQGAEVVVVMPHWGSEGEVRASPRQRRLARWLIDAGADAVVGSHPHVAQDTEVYRGRPIVYSLGNFVFDGYDEDKYQLGWMLSTDIDRFGIRRLSTQVVRMDEAHGVPVPAPEVRGPCWARGQAAMAPCGASAQGAVEK